MMEVGIAGLKPMHKAILALVVFGLGLSWNRSAFRPPLLTQLAMLIWLISGLQCVPLPPSLWKHYPRHPTKLTGDGLRRR